MKILPAVVLAAMLANGATLSAQSPQATQSPPTLPAETLLDRAILKALDEELSGVAAKDHVARLTQLHRERKTKVYVITGRATFSAGLFHALQLRQKANAILVGEPVGDELDFWSEGGNVLTPNSRLSLHYADRFHSMSSVEHAEFSQYLVTDTDLSVTNAMPDIPVKMSVSDYFAGRDPALEAARSGPSASVSQSQSWPSSLSPST